MNIAVGKPAFMSSWYKSRLVATQGNDGNRKTRFLTRYGSEAWWAVDFGQKRTRVTRVRVTNYKMYYGMCRGNLSIGSYYAINTVFLRL